MKTPPTSPKIRLASALLASLSLLTACAARNDDWDVRVMNGDTGKPEPGVMVLFWRHGRTIGVWGNHSAYCDNEHLAITDEQGMVKVPRDITGMPLRYKLMNGIGYFSSLPYKRGMVNAWEVDTPEERALHTRSITREQREKEPNLLQILTIRADAREPRKRAAYLRGQTDAGCTCSQVTRAMFSEAREIYVPPPGVGIGGGYIREAMCNEK